jgi:hypothetical protein
MHRRADGHLHRLQIQLTRSVPFRQNHRQQRFYFPRNLLMDCSSRFFS